MPAPQWRTVTGMHDPQRRDQQYGGDEVVGQAVIWGEMGNMGGHPGLGGSGGKGRVQHEVARPRAD